MILKQSMIKKNLKMNTDSKKKIDTALFDTTIRQIEKTLGDLGKEIEPKEDFQINTKPQEEPINDFDEDHIIDNTHLRMEELHSFNLKKEVKNKNSLGFYTYLALGIGVIFAIYELLNISKILIISKYPASEPYIEYFYEVIEILTYVVINIISFVKNLF